jgi:hypothetical protein
MRGGEPRPAAAASPNTNTPSVPLTADSLAFRADQVWRELAQCPPDALPWAALGYAATTADTHHARARQLALDGFAAARLARPILARARFAELSEQRSRPPTSPCTAKCDRCSACVRATVATSNMQRLGSPDWPGRRVVAA